MLRLKALSKAYEHKTVLKEISFDCDCPELVSVLGPSGSGKSTLLKLISGLIQPDGGSVTLDHRDVTAQAPEQRGMVYISQEPSLFTHMTVLDNLCFGLDIRGIPRKAVMPDLQRLIRLLELEGLENRYPRALSGGQRQRVAIGRGLAVKPSVLLLDEPFSSLDLSLRTSMGQMIRGIRESFEVTILLVTHDPSEAMAFSDRILLLHQGEILDSGKPEILYRQPRSLQAGQMLGRLIPLPAVLKGRMTETADRHPASERRRNPSSTGVITIPEVQGEGVHLLKHYYRPETLALVRLQDHEDADSGYVVKGLRRDGLEQAYVLSGPAGEFEMVSAQKMSAQEGDQVQLYWLQP